MPPMKKATNPQAQANIWKTLAISLMDAWKSEWDQPRGHPAILFTTAP